MQVILDSSFSRPGSAPIWGGKEGEFRDWTIGKVAVGIRSSTISPKFGGEGGEIETSNFPLTFNLLSCPKKTEI